jgi:adenylate kinase
MNANNTYGRQIAIVIVLEVPDAEIQERLSHRGREQDTPEIITERLDLYRRETDPLLGYFDKQNIVIARIDGTGTVDEIHERIMGQIEANGLA